MQRSCVRPHSPATVAEGVDGEGPTPVRNRDRVPSPNPGAPPDTYPRPRAAQDRRHSGADLFISHLAAYPPLPSPGVRRKRAVRGEGTLVCPGGCGRSYQRPESVARHVKKCTGEKTAPTTRRSARSKGMRPVAKLVNPLGPFRKAKGGTIMFPLIEPGHNFTKHWWGCRSPYPQALTRALACAHSYAAEAASAQDGHYSKTPLGPEQVQNLLRELHPSCARLDQILRGWGLKQRPKFVAHLYMLDGGVDRENTVGAHSDSGGVVLMQLVGRKRLRIGGVHRTPEGSRGNTVPLEGAPLTRFQETAAECELQPNNAVGFARRQTHQLTTMTIPNLSLSVSVEQLPP